MMFALLRKRLAPIRAIAILAGGLVAGGHAQTGDDLVALNAQVEGLFKAGKYAEALPLAERAVKAAEAQHGPDDVAVTGPLLKLGEVLSGFGRVPEAEPYERRALAIREAALGPNHPDTAKAMVALAGTNTFGIWAARASSELQGSSSPAAIGGLPRWSITIRRSETR